MFDRVKLVCLNNADGKKDWLEKTGGNDVVFSADQIRSSLLIGEELPEKLIFDGQLKDFIRLFPERTPEESCELVNGYLESGVAEWVEQGWEFFTCRAAVLGCCSGFYLSVLNRKELK